MNVWTKCMQHSQRPQDGSRSPGTGVAGTCKLPVVDCPCDFPFLSLPFPCGVGVGWSGGRVGWDGMEVG